MKRWAQRFLYRWCVPLIGLVLIGMIVALARRYGQSLTHRLAELSTKDLSEVVKNYAQALVWVAGGGFFGYKALSGYQIVNLSVGLEATRVSERVRDGDLLKVAVTLSKGDRGTIQLHDIKGRVRGDDGVVLKDLCFDVVRLDHDRQSELWESVNPRNPFLNLAPSESTILSGCVSVPSGMPCLVEVVVFGKRRSGIQMGQWRASCVSLPSPSSPQSLPGFFGVLRRLLS
jgi:hypothetical protein